MPVLDDLTLQFLDDSSLSIEALNPKVKAGLTIPDRHPPGRGEAESPLYAVFHCRDADIEIVSVCMLKQCGRHFPSLVFVLVNKNDKGFFDLFLFIPLSLPAFSAHTWRKPEKNRFLFPFFVEATTARCDSHHWTS
jgi:hypothetical protein